LYESAEARLEGSIKGESSDLLARELLGTVDLELAAIHAFRYKADRTRKGEATQTERYLKEAEVSFNRMTESGSPIVGTNGALGLGNVYLARLEYERAAAQFDKAIQIRERDPSLRGHSGQIHAQRAGALFYQSTQRRARAADLLKEAREEAEEAKRQ